MRFKCVFYDRFEATERRPHHMPLCQRSRKREKDETRWRAGDFQVVRRKRTAIAVVEMKALASHMPRADWPRGGSSNPSFRAHIAPNRQVAPLPFFISI